MADFRKWILGLAVVTLFASLASAQSSVNCQARSSVRVVYVDGAAHVANTLPHSADCFTGDSLTSAGLSTGIYDELTTTVNGCRCSPQKTDLMLGIA